MSTSFYYFTQNNSGGVFIEPAVDVVIEAEDPDFANYRAEREGLYFDGCDSGDDCSCCGDRWSRQWSTDEGDSVPSTYGIPVILDNVPVDEQTVLVVYIDGTRRWGKRGKR